jgi:PKD repeat protein
MTKLQKTISTLFSGLILFIISSNVFAQVSEGGIPPSFANSGWAESSKTPPVVFQAGFDVMTQIEADNKEIEGMVAVPLKIGKVLPVDLDMAKSGEWKDLPDGTRIWQLTVKLPGALASMLHYDRFVIPEGGKLFIYSADRRQILGAYTHKTNVSKRLFATELLCGDEFTVEYVSPASGSIEPKSAKPQIHITEIVYVYNHVGANNRNSGVKLAGFGNSGSCEVNVNCEEGANWQDQKRGVVKTVSSIGNTTYLCSGTIINNAAQDLKPYLLSAYHCFGSQTETEMAQTVFYFNYETEGCLNDEEPVDYGTLIGADVLVLNPITGESDGALLLLKDQIPSYYNVYFNGWDNRNTAPESGVGIHHPSGDVKKISTFTSPAESSTWTSNLGAYEAHWNVYFVKTVNGWGVCEAGSSGSPLFNQNGLVVGTLTGGSASCTYPYGTNQYGKLWYHWDKSSNADRHMKTYLDPDDTGINTLAGTYTKNTVPLAAFRASTTDIFALESVTYTNQSLGAASYHWIFEGGTPASANERNPEPVAYSQPGTYATTLIINEGTSAEKSHTQTITVSIKGGVAEPPVADFSFLKVFFEESFDGELFPPADWTIEKKGESNEIWFNNNVKNKASSDFSVIDPNNVYSAVIFYDDKSFVDSWLQSPTWQIPADAYLEFYAGYSGNWLADGVLNLHLSTDNGVSWIQKWTNGPDYIPGLDWGWHKVIVDLNEYSGQQLRFAWQYCGQGGDMAGVDGIKIIAPLPLNTPVTIYVGDEIYPTDCSTGPPVLYNWTFENGTPESSSQERPIVRYWKAGTHSITLQVKNTEGESIKEFPRAVTVRPRELKIDYEAQGGYTLYPDYGRFIPAGSTIRYFDKTTNYPVSWNWTFEGGTPSASSEQNPSVVYDAEGNYGMQFTATNDFGKKTVTVPNFVKVGGEAKIWNMDKGEKGEDVPTDWLGYRTGTNNFNETHFAERFEAPLTAAAIKSVDIAFYVGSASSGNLEIAIMNDDDGYPGEVIDKITLPASSIRSSGYTTVNFPNPVPVRNIYYVSVGNFSKAPFQIAVKHQERYVERKQGLKNTTYVFNSFQAASLLGHGPGWFTISEYRLNSYISLNVVPSLLYGSYMTVSGENSYKRKNIDDTVETITVHSNIAWVATSSSDWIEINNASGDGDGSFSFTVKDNPGQARRGVLIVGRGEFQKSFLIEQAGPPASNLTVTETTDPPGNIELTWNAPVIAQWTQAIDQKQAAAAVQRIYLGWSDGEMFDVFGKEAGGAYEVAARFEPSDLMQYNSAAIKEVEIYIENFPIDRKLTLKFHQGGKVIYSQEVEVSDTEFISIPLEEDLYIDSSQDLYVGYFFNQTPGVYVAGADAGPAVPGKGNLVTDDGGKTFYSVTNFNINYNWIISMWIDTGSRLDYLVYRNDRMIGTTAQLTYQDQLQEAGNYCYKVVTRYDGSLPTIDSNIACINYIPVGLSHPAVGEMQLYPNPVDKSLVISSQDPITSIIVTDVAGQVIFIEKNIKFHSNEKVIDTSLWPTGIYMVRISTVQKETAYKVVKK